MLPRDFDRLVKQNFGSILEPRGFTSANSQKSTFYRRLDGDIYHFIIADQHHHQPMYDIMVFASSPKIDPQFEAGFPDGLGVPSDTHCRLNAKGGIGIPGSKFPCGTAKAFLAAFNAAVSPALTNVAVPYLDSIFSIEALVATIRHPAFKNASA